VVHKTLAAEDVDTVEIVLTLMAAGSGFCVCGPRALESQSFFRADVAQLAEHITRNDGVLGSIPSVGSKTAQHTAAFPIPHPYL
jgi:hypothetical protein